MHFGLYKRMASVATMNTSSQEFPKKHQQKNPSVSTAHSDDPNMSANGMSRVFTPVVQGKGQQGSMNNMQNYSTGDNISYPVTGACCTGGSLLSGNTVNAPPPPPPQVPSHYSTFGIGGNSSF